MKPCARCGEPTSIWQRDLTSGICRKCRKAEAAAHPYSLTKLTPIGWLLTLATIGVIVGLMIPYGVWLNELLPADRRPPYLLLALPVLGVALLVFTAGALVLKELGMPAWKQEQKDNDQPEDQKLDG